MAATHLDPLALMTKLISFPTVSRDSNLPLVDWVEVLSRFAWHPCASRL